MCVVVRSYKIKYASASTKSRRRSKPQNLNGDFAATKVSPERLTCNTAAVVSLRVLLGSTSALLWSMCEQFAAGEVLCRKFMLPAACCLLPPKQHHVPCELLQPFSLRATQNREIYMCNLCTYFAASTLII